jgi:hypothetical protein
LDNEFLTIRRWNPMLCIHTMELWFGILADFLWDECEETVQVGNRAFTGWFERFPACPSETSPSSQLR